MLRNDEDEVLDAGAANVRDDESNEVEWDESEVDLEDEDDDALAIPALPPHPPRAALPEDFFFAHNQAEYDERSALITPVHDHFAATAEKIRRMTQQSRILKNSATTAEIRQKLTEKINAELLQLKQYKGFLDDLIRRHQGINDYLGNVRDVDFIERPDLEPGETHEELVAYITERIDHINLHIAALSAASARVTKETAVNPQKSAFYSKLNDHQTFNGDDHAINLQHATEAASQFISRRIQMQQAGAPDRLAAAAGAQETFTDVRYDCRFIGTELIPKPGKPAIPVALIQEINPEKTYSKQTMLLAPGHLKQLDNLPWLTRDKIAKIKEQMKFVANSIETILASITTNGPILLNDWPKNLGKAAAVYCHLMGYDLQPRQFLADIQPAALETLTRAFIAQIQEDAELTHLIQEARARRDTKSLATAHRL